ncbi:hypothetical protein [Iodobacter sp.]|uniref:hypothetical protein n=1 Tax=Iodobacter sp. TaxID=1915058 RepID=UPI0025EC00A7|nr:hypothetical protein [Iodobacter sp.]
MASVIINDKLVGDILDILTKETTFPRSSFYCEIQDDFQLLFISISIDNFPENEVELSLKRIAEILNSLMPTRSNDYSWVVGLKRENEVVDSCFGGNLSASNWGV